MKLSATQAAEQVGKSIPTITRAIKTGKLSASKRDGGGYDIDPAELFRVWPAVSNDTNVTPKLSGNETPNSNKVLEREIELLREMLEKTENDRDSWKDQAQRVTALIEDKTAKPHKWFWQK
jgi:hypothetical protein